MPHLIRSKRSRFTKRRDSLSRQKLKLTQARILICFLVLLVAGVTLAIHTKTNVLATTTTNMEFFEETNGVNAHPSKFKQRQSPPLTVSTQTESIKSQNTKTNMRTFTDPTSPHFQKLNEIQKTQIRNYLNGTGLILNVHITHHGGTTLCRNLGFNGGRKDTPNFFCKGGSNWPANLPKRNVWRNPQETDQQIRGLRYHFHFIAWEYRFFPTGSLHQTHWENPNLISILVMKHPIDRFLSKGPCDGFSGSTRSQAEWWDYANHPCADNYALRILAHDNRCCVGKDTSPDYVERAKTLLKRMTFVLDIDCLDLALEELYRLLHLEPGSKLTKPKGRRRPSRLERLGRNATLLKYLEEKFQQDIRLYEWSQTIRWMSC